MVLASVLKMQKKLNWQVYSDGNRNKVINEIQTVISTNDGYIINFNIFSDFALCLSVEIEENKIIYLHQALKEILKISDIVIENISQESKEECLIFINISFSMGKGALKIEIPEVPG